LVLFVITEYPRLLAQSFEFFMIADFSEYTSEKTELQML